MLHIEPSAIADGTDVNQLPHTYRGWKYARDLLNDKLSALIFVSESLRAEGYANNLRGKKNAVIHNAVDTDLFRPNSSRRKEDVFTILAVGRLIPLKGAHILLDAFAELSQRLPAQVRLILVGEGPLRDAR